MKKNKQSAFIIAVLIALFCGCARDGNGHEQVYELGIESGYETGYEAGYEVGYTDGYTNGSEIGRHDGRSEGYSEGERAKESELEDDIPIAYEKGGNQAAYNLGMQEGIFDRVAARSMRTQKNIDDYNSYLLTHYMEHGDWDVYYDWFLEGYEYGYNNVSEIFSN
jgi:hypothetical protein